MTNISGEKLRKIKQVTHHNVVKNCKQPDNGVSEQVIINNHTCILNRDITSLLIHKTCYKLYNPL
jgi:hypothetical protein